MKNTVRLMFDENLGRPIVTALAGLLRFYDPSPVVQHVIDFEQQEGVDDRDWIPKLASEGWVVISSDLGRKKREARLPAICEANRVTHILIRGRMHHERQFEKARAVILLWPKILEAAEGPRGKRYAIQRGPSNPVLVEKS